jgi:hypothetical protein
LEGRDGAVRLEFEDEEGFEGVGDFVAAEESRREEKELSV